MKFELNNVIIAKELGAFEMEKINNLIKKFCTKEVILYIVFGVLTTIVNLVVSFALNALFIKGGLEEKIAGSLSSAFGIIAAVLVAYFTNRKLVFNSEASSLNEKLREFGRFILGRAFTMLVEEGGVIVFNGIAAWNYQIVKLAFTVIVVILNYFISKLFAFKTKKS